MEAGNARPAPPHSPPSPVFRAPWAAGTRCGASHEGGEQALRPIDPKAGKTGGARPLRRSTLRARKIIALRVRWTTDARTLTIYKCKSVSQFLVRVCVS